MSLRFTSLSLLFKIANSGDWQPFLSLITLVIIINKIGNVNIYISIETVHLTLTLI